VARQTFRQSDVTRAVKAIRDAGVPVGEIEVDLVKGRVHVFPPGAANAVRGRRNDFDAEFG
jgi:hypothetical protein